jgi:hypothetical protein
MIGLRVAKVVFLPELLHPSASLNQKLLASGVKRVALGAYLDADFRLCGARNKLVAAVAPDLALKILWMQFLFQEQFTSFKALSRRVSAPGAQHALYHAPKRISTFDFAVKQFRHFRAQSKILVRPGLSFEPV